MTLRFFTALIASWLLAGTAAHAQGFDFDTLTQKARERARQAWQAPANTTPPELARLNYDGMRDIRWRAERALWRDAQLPFEAMFFHLASYHTAPVRIHEVTLSGPQAGVRPLAFRSEDFDYGKNQLDPQAWGDIGFAGFRLHYPLNTTAYKDELAVFQGASYFRALGAGQQYGKTPATHHVLMKVETHNHPTAISPFPGASTGAGGEIRDEGATGRGSKPKAGLTGFTVSRLWGGWSDAPGGKPGHIASPLQIMTEGPLGGAAFNNEFGRPNLLGYFREYEQTITSDADSIRRGYHKPIMIAGGLGSIDATQTKKIEFPAGTLLIQLGGPGMRIGMGGSAASSICWTACSPAALFWVTSAMRRHRASTDSSGMRASGSRTSWGCSASSLKSGSTSRWTDRKYESRGCRMRTETVF